ncbi:MAG: HlyD family efflux transporter periplasmic adaptor subunit [Burkholderiales bacterium]|nr:HlyD family efflux transporter periplasmic adaptor subunit [Burkholderiales bacterium]
MSQDQDRPAGTSDAAAAGVSPTPAPSPAPAHASSQAASQASSPASAAAGSSAGLPSGSGDSGSRRRSALLGIAVLVAIGAIGWWLWGWLHGQTEATDNAYVQANVVQISAINGGTVVAVAVDDNDYVKAGQTLVKLDPADARIVLEQAEARLAQTVREVRQLYTGNSALKSQVGQRDAELARAQAEVARATDDLNRREPLVASGAVGREEAEHARAQLATAKSALAAAAAAVQTAREQFMASQNLTEGSSVAQHPQVRSAAAKVREAWLALKRNEVLAPIDAHVVRRSVQLGQRVAPGAPLLGLVALRDAWVDANFKEVQLGRLRIGQPAVVRADVYGDSVEFRGKVIGLGSGTGAAFALLPAQNATGNWIKVVQRVPVRIQLDARELIAHPLRVGLSMHVTVDVSKQDGKLLADAPRAQPLAQTDLYDTQLRQADMHVQRIISANLGRIGKPAAPFRPASPQPAMPLVRQVEPDAAGQTLALADDTSR